MGQPIILEPLQSVEPERITSQFNELQMNEIMKRWSSHHTPKNIASSFYIFLLIKVFTHKVFTKACKLNFLGFYQLVFSYENGENSLELPIMIYEILFFFKK